MCRVSGPLWDLVVWQEMVYEGETWLVFHKCVFNLDLALFFKIYFYSEVIEIWRKKTAKTKMRGIRGGKKVFEMLPLLEIYLSTCKINP